jgi:hypothetical protein
MEEQGKLPQQFLLAVAVAVRVLLAVLELPMQAVPEVMELLRLYQEVALPILAVAEAVAMVEVLVAPVAAALEVMGMNLPVQLLEQLIQAAVAAVAAKVHRLTEIPVLLVVLESLFLN